MQAQSTIQGVVRDSAKRPIANAEVMLVEPDRRVRTDSTGVFTFSGLDSGTYELRARRLGFFPAQTTTTLRRGSIKTLVFELDPRGTTLATINVTAPCERTEFTGFVCRRRKAELGERVGLFLDEAQIDSAGLRFPIDFFRDVPGFRVIANPRAPGLMVQSLVGNRCITYIVNGKRPSFENPMPRWPGDMIGVEVYANPDDIPPEYKQFEWGTSGSGRGQVKARCTLVNYWTSGRPRYPAGSKPR